jgi:hypothetical protein
VNKASGRGTKSYLRQSVCQRCCKYRSELYPYPLLWTPLIIQLLSNGTGKEFCPYIHLKFHQFDVNCVCLINVDAAPKPAYVQEGNEAKFFLRTGNSTQQLNTKEAIEYVASHWDKEKSKV